MDVSPTNLVVETDGWRYHGTRYRYRADTRKQAALEAAGRGVMRLNWGQVTTLENQTAARLLRAVERGGGRRLGQ